RTSSPSRAKSAAKIEGAMMSGCRIRVAPRGELRLTRRTRPSNAARPLSRLAAHATRRPPRERSEQPGLRDGRNIAMAQVNAVVLGAGIVGTSVALHLVKRGLAVALIDRRAPGEETSYGNAGVIEGSMLLPPAFPSDFSALLRIALKR